MRVFELFSVWTWKQVFHFAFSFICLPLCLKKVLKNFLESLKFERSYREWCSKLELSKIFSIKSLIFI